MIEELRYDDAYNSDCFEMVVKINEAIEEIEKMREELDEAGKAIKALQRLIDLEPSA